MNKEKWEVIFFDEPVGDYLERMVVPGGWVYRTRRGYGNPIIAMTFVPYATTVP